MVVSSDCNGCWYTTLHSLPRVLVFSHSLHPVHFDHTLFHLLSRVHRLHRKYRLQNHSAVIAPSCSDIVETTAICALRGGSGESLSFQCNFPLTTPCLIDSPSIPAPLLVSLPVLHVRNKTCKSQRRLCLMLYTRPTTPVSHTSWTQEPAWS